ncbi:MAG: conjugative transfer system coupling protein TraD [Betaproteobacteria bacterium]|nr:conjugative transfer system coupling protein TraD [Betaproteobacteria bacterium]
MLMRHYEMPWRRAYELYAGGAWALALVFFVVVGATGRLPRPLALPLSVVCFAMGLLRVTQALDTLVLRASLTGRSIQVIGTDDLAQWCRNPADVFLGFGFEWHPVHSQRLYELAKIDYRDFTVSPRLLRWLGHDVSPQPNAEIGLPYIHGVEPREVPLHRPLQNFEGGTLLVGTTQSGKGVALASLVTQAIRRGDVVIVIDPKNSRRLKRVVERLVVQILDPSTGVALIPAVTIQLSGSSQFQDVTIDNVPLGAVNVVVQGLVELEERPNLVKLTKYIEGGIEPVLEGTLRRFYDETLGAGWRERPDVKKLLQDAQRGNIKRPSEAASNDLLAFVAYYEHHVAQSQRSKVVDAQVRTFRHNREHYQKITANLLPVLSMLTSGDLGRSLSPDPFDADDMRPIVNFEKVERAGHVLYMCLDSLPDPSVATAIGALALADLAARAGMRYNLGGYRRISLFVDEVSNVINQPLIEILNKGAEGGIFTTCAMQTLADLAKRLGSEDAARMALGNLNNLIALRSKDRPTQDFVVETFGKTAIHTMRVGLSSGGDAHLGDFSSSYSTQLTESFEEMVPADVLGKLPNLQYFASVSGGRIIKGRFPILNPDFDRPAATATGGQP